MIKCKFFLLLIYLLIGSNLLKANDMELKLNNKQKSIAKISAYTAVGDLEELETAINKSLEQDLTVSEIKEVLIQMYAYCGFPRSLQGINTLMKVVTQWEKEDRMIQWGNDASILDPNKDKYQEGKEMLQKLTLVEETKPTGANAFAPTIDRFLKEHLFADIFERDVLTYQEREIATIAALSSLNGVNPMLEAHKQMGINIGLSEAQVNDISQIGTTIGSEFRGIFPLGALGSNNWFTGEVYVETLLTPEQMEGLYNVGQVTFKPNGRTLWHTHPIGQTLLVVDGDGWYQERGKEAIRLTKGSVIAIPKDVEHWHGASNHSSLVHIAISNMLDGSNVTWGNPVSQAEYDAVNK